ncbi:MAG: hypothetical protein HY608_01245 [Planctomycetes bacterium]|nr:hypothetical protein [Planctomycetota bacterium]
MVVLTCLGVAGPAQEPEAPAPAAWDPAKPIAYLLDHQNEDGTWYTGLQVNPDTGGGITVGTTALACMALLEWRDAAPERADVALDKGVAACLRFVWKRQEAVRDFESVNWGQVFTLQLLGRLMRHPAWVARRDELRRQIDDILPWFWMRQNRTGGWGYRSSFQTGAALIMLHELREAGIPHDETKLRAAIEMLKNLRGPLGYRYSEGSTVAQQQSVGEAQALREAAGRQGVAEYSLFLFGEVSRDDLAATMGKFIEHRDYLWETRRLAGEGEWVRMGNASPFAYFAFFGYRYGAMALGGVPPPRRAEWSGILREDLLRVMEADGTWRNFPFDYERPGRTGYPGDDGPTRVWTAMQPNVEPGSKIYATSMALLALRHIEGPVRE